MYSTTAPQLLDLWPADGVKVLDRPIAQHSAKQNVIGLFVPHRLEAVLLKRGAIFRMNQVEIDLIGQLRRFRVEAEDAPFLLGPEQLAGLGIHGPAAGVTELLGFGQIGGEPPQFAFRPVPVGDVDGGGNINRRAVLAPGMVETNVLAQIGEPSFRR